MSQQPSINPKDMLTIFQEDYRRDLSDLLSVYAGKEKRRTDTESEASECESRIHFRHMPTDVFIALQTLKEDTGHSFKTLTKCMSHHVVAWCNTLSIREITGSSVWINSMAARYGGMSDIVEQVEALPFHYLKNDYRRSEFSSIEWVQANLVSLIRGTGVDLCELFGIGVMWSLATDKTGMIDGVVRRTFLPEIENFTQYIEERAILINAYKEIVGIRVSHADREILQK